jgi:hypothetical protein
MDSNRRAGVPAELRGEVAAELRARIDRGVATYVHSERANRRGELGGGRYGGQS